MNHALRAIPALGASVRQLMILRWIAAGGQTLAIATCAALGVRLPLAAMASVIAVLVALNLITASRLQGRGEPSHAEVAAHLAIDLAAFSALLYFADGAANPFSALFVLHAVLMALLLPPLAAATGAAVVVACFVALSHAGVALEMEGGGPVPLQLQELGRVIAFALTTGVSAWFVLRIVATLREHDRLLAEAERKALRDDAVLRVGALAAGAAHELSTPLTTMAVVAGEIDLHADTPDLKRDAAVLLGQVAICRETITNMLAAAGHAGAVGGGRESLSRFLESIAERCRTTRPEARIVCEPDPTQPDAEIFAEEGLRQALLVLLNNAVDVSPEHVRLAGLRNGNALRLSISDRGNGLPDTEIERLGRAVFTTKPRGEGAGLGLVLARRAVERLGGTLGWERRAGGGMRAVITLPWEVLSLGAKA